MNFVLVLYGIIFFNPFYGTSSLLYEYLINLKLIIYRIELIP